MLGIRLGVNDLYLRDVSKKVRTSFRAKQNKGDYIGSLPLYGYIKDPNDKHKLIIDDNVASNIELIYDLAFDGMTPQKIAETLTMKKIPIPVVYKKEKRANNITENDGFGIWKRQTIKGILTNEMYIGNMVQNTFNKISYNSKKTRKTRDEEKIIVKNTHDSIISQEKFDKVQKILNERSDKYKKDSYVREGQLEYLLGGLLYCKDCGRSIRISKDILKGTIRHYTQCNLYTRKGKYGICSSHRINYDWLEEDVIEYLQQLCEQFCKQYDFSEIEDNSDNIIIKKIEEIKIKQKNIEDGIKAINTTIDNLYIDKTKGLVDEEMYKRIYSKSKAELLKYEITLKQINKDKSIYDQKNHAESSFTKCKSAGLKYMALKEPTRDQIIRLIKKIEIDSERKIYVYLKFKEMEVKQ